MAKQLLGYPRNTTDITNEKQIISMCNKLDLTYEEALDYLIDPIFSTQKKVISHYSVRTLDTKDGFGFLKNNE